MKKNKMFHVGILVLGLQKLSPECKHALHALLRKRILGVGKKIFLEEDAIPASSFRS